MRFGLVECSFGFQKNHRQWSDVIAESMTSQWPDSTRSWGPKRRWPVTTAGHLSGHWSLWMGLTMLWSLATCTTSICGLCEVDGHPDVLVGFWKRIFFSLFFFFHHLSPPTSKENTLVKWETSATSIFFIFHASDLVHCSFFFVDYC